MPESDKNKLVVALLLAMFLAAIEGTIVTLAIPTIVKDLQGFDLISHVFSVYLLTGAIATPVYGKLSDLYGRKRVLFIGISIFLFGSMLCGFAQNMTQLIIFRAIQGIGAGSIFTVPMTIVGDTFPLEQRGKIQGLLSSVWGIAGLVGPFLGGVLIDLFSWHWIFFINIPFGILTLIIIQTSFKESFVRRPHKIDFFSIVILTASMLSFLSIFIFSSREADYFTLQNLALFLTSIIFMLLFVFVEKRVDDPLVPLDVLNRSSALINIVSFLFTAALLGVDVYLPIYLQNVYGFGPFFAGLAILPMTLSWILVSFPIGRLILRFGIKTVTILSLIATLSGLIPMLLFDGNSTIYVILVAVLWLGVGFGTANTSQTMFIQDSVGYEKRGSAVALNSLVRTIGQTIGITAFGAAFNFNIIQGFENAGVERYDLGNLYDMSAYAEGVQWAQIAAILSDAIHAVVWILIGLVAVSIIVAVFLPRTKRQEIR
ncbi:MAG TPA: MFS transporter [Coriobacteriia bacterium]|nr:MFS transporter [Coriobacteriia bacterium]